MKKTTKPASEVALVGQLAAIICISSFFYYLRRGDLLLYGDAVAHINIARRVFDSRTPGLLQLGTVWLPLPHILTLPFIVSRWMWQSGVGGSIPSLFAYVLSVSGIFRLMQTLLASGDNRKLAGTRLAPWLAAGIFALNPNLIYLQTTAMTESVYLAFFIWAVVFLGGALRDCSQGDAFKGNAKLVKAGLCLAGACLTRYDGWLLAAVISLVSVLLAWKFRFSPLRAGAKKLIVLCAVAPVFWLAYNAIVYRNPLEFANGPYSAKAIEQKTIVAGTPPHPGTHNLPVAFHYFLKSAELNMADGKWQIFWTCALLLGTAIVILFQRRLWPLLLLWLPVPFYMISIAYSGTPIYVPSWWPFSYYNVRYGIEMLPAFAVFTAAAAYGLLRFAANTRVRLAITILFLLLVTSSYLQVWRKGAASFEEAVINSRSRIALETALASNLQTLPPNSSFLMYLGDHVGAFERAGIPLSHVFNEGNNHRSWIRPMDADGLWDRALAHPAAYANYVIASDSDMVASSVNRNELTTLVILRVTGQPEATIYATTKSNQAR